jgi:hypothetical protein
MPGVNQPPTMFRTPPAAATMYDAANPTCWDVAYLGSASADERTYELNLGDSWVHLTRKGNRVEATFVSMAKFRTADLAHYTPQRAAHEMAIYLRTKRLTVALEATPSVSDLDVLARAYPLYHAAISWALAMSYEDSHHIPGPPKPAFLLQK